MQREEEAPAAKEEAAESEAEEEEAEEEEEEEEDEDEIVDPKEKFEEGGCTHIQTPAEGLLVIGARHNCTRSLQPRHNSAAYVLFSCVC